MITMRRFSLIPFVFLLSLLFISCDKENSQDNSPKSKEFSLLLGEWQRDKAEGYKNGSMVKTHSGFSGVFLIFKSSGEYINKYYAGFKNYKGSFKIKKKTLTLDVEFLDSRNEIESYTEECEILELTDEKLVIKSPYEDTEYDYQIEYVLQDFSPVKSSILHVWQNQGVTCKGFRSFIDNSRFNCVKLNGTAMFSFTSGNELIDPNIYDLPTIEKWYSDDFDRYKSSISFAWEKDDTFIDSILPLVSDAKVLVVIGYSFPYVNRAVDRKLVQNMTSLRSVYIQDMAASDVKQSFETLLSENQQKGVAQQIIRIHSRTSVAQFIIPNELT